jgi:hypothetical protein
MADENPFAKYMKGGDGSATPATPASPSAAPTSDNPFAKFAPPPAAAAPPPPSGSTFNTQPAMDPVFHAVVAPALNWATAPVRSGLADLIAAIPGIGALPTDQASREKWRRVRDQIVEKTGIPENSVGQAISQIASFPGSMVTSGVADVSRRVLGDKVTDALAPYAQTAADLLPFGTAALGRARGRQPLPPEMQFHPGAQGAHGAGYNLAPEDISDRPPAVATALSGIAGKDKKFQSLSEGNQTNTNRLAARSLGLPENTRFTRQTFDDLRDRVAGPVYAELDRAVPQVALGADPAFRAEMNGVGRQEAVLEEAFPSSAHNPTIEHIRQTMLDNPFQSVEAVRKKIADLRFEAGKNFRNSLDPQAGNVARAQRQAADALEHSIERSIGYGEARVSAMGERYAAEQQAAAARAALGGARTAPPGGMPAAQARLDQARRVEAIASIRDPAREAAARDLINRYQQARQLFARSYDVEAAFNRGTGDISAARIARLRGDRYSRQLTGELEQIANAYDSFPKSLMNPERFGHVEDYSILDIGSAATAAGAGHYGLVGGILGRPLARSIVTRRPAFQERQFGGPVTLSNRLGITRDVSRRPLSTEGAGYRAGAVLQQPPPDQDDLSYRYGPELGAAMRQLQR